MRATAWMAALASIAAAAHACGDEAERGRRDTATLGDDGARDDADAVATEPDVGLDTVPETVADTVPDSEPDAPPPDSALDSTPDGDDAVDEVDTTTDDAPDSAETADVGDVVDPCTPNPCTRPPAPRCEDGAVVDTAAPGSCSVVDAAASCSYAPTTTPCPVDTTCYAGACLALGDNCSYPVDPRASYVYRIHMGQQGANDPATGQPVDACCFDFTGDGKIDNRLGDIFDAASTFAGDINALIQDEVDRDGLVLVFETRGVSDLANDPDVAVAGFYGTNPDGDHASDVAGTGTLAIDPTSFAPGTASPIAAFGEGHISNGVLTAGPARFQLRLPLFGAPLDILVSDTRLEAVVALGPNGQGLTFDGTRLDPDTSATFGAELGGVIRQSDLIGALNDFVAGCGCIEFPSAAEGDLITIDGDAANCQVPVAKACGDWACDQLPELCPLLMALAAPDVDLDGDGLAVTVHDGLSLGVFIKATSAHVSGVDGCPAR